HGGKHVCALAGRRIDPDAASSRWRTSRGSFMTTREPRPTTSVEIRDVCSLARRRIDPDAASCGTQAFGAKDPQSETRRDRTSYSFRATAWSYAPVGSVDTNAVRQSTKR